MENSLTKLFESLSVPSEVDGETATFSSIVSPISNHIHIGKDAEGRPVIIVKILSDQPDLSQETLLRNLRVAHSIRCKISPVNAAPFIDRFSIVHCLSQDHLLQEYFLNIMQVILEEINIENSFDRIKYSLDKLIELFHLLDQPSSTSVRGLWAELFIIVNANDPLYMIDTWHIDMRDRFDFSSGEQRLEVKSSGTRARQHHLSCEQAYPPTGTTALIASLFVEKTGRGKSLEDLWKEACDIVAQDAEFILKIENICLSIVGTNWLLAKNNSYDEQLARESLAFFDINDIPRVPNIRVEGVTDVRFVSNLDVASPVNIHDYSESGPLFNASKPRHSCKTKGTRE